LTIARKKSALLESLYLLNEYTLYQNLPGAKRIYGFVTSGFGPFGGSPAKSSDCTECGSCEEQCPQKIKIIDAHKEAVRLFEQE
jgi:hypothetical protein